MTTCTRAGGCAGTNYPFLTLKERDIETGLDYFEARYYSNLQGRFTGADPYNIVLETQAGADINPERAQRKLNNYLALPQQWNRYSYTINNPLKYVDPTGEQIWLTGTKEEQEAALVRLREMLGSDLSKYITTKQMDTHVGTVTVVDYQRSGDPLARVGGEFGVRLAEIIESNRVVEFRIAKEFDDKSGHHTTAYFGGLLLWVRRKASLVTLKSLWLRMLI